MSIWFCKPMLVLEYSEKKDSRQLEVQTTPLDNSNFWRPYFSSMVVRHTDATPLWFYTHSTRTSCMSWLSSILASIQLSLDRLCTNNSYINCTTSQWPLCQSCFTPALTSRKSIRNLRNLKNNGLCQPKNTILKEENQKWTIKSTLISIKSRRIKIFRNQTIKNSSFIP